MADAISIEETNKVRLALGMKPLPVPGQDGPTFKQAASEDEEEAASTLETRQAQGYDNWKQLQEEAERKKKNQARNEAIKKARDLAQKHAKLEGKGLGEESDEELDTRSWLVQQKKRQKKLEKQRAKAKKMEEELMEREKQEYTSKDLAGVKVAHEVGDFDLEGEDQVLTLKDTTIDENEEEGDELENINLREKEKLDERLELKKKKPVYDAKSWDDTEEHKVLSQYDEVIDGKKRKRFTLDAQGSTMEEREAKKQSIGEKLNAKAFSLTEVVDDTPISDYQEPKEVSFKKPKKKKSKSTRKKADDEDDVFPTPQENGDSMDVDEGSAPVTKASDSFLDDDDLQASLAKQRRAALKKRKAVKPEDIARQIREQEASAAAEEMEGVDNGEMVINEASQFLANIHRPEERPAPKSPSTQALPPGSNGDAKHEESSDNDDDGDEDVDMDTPDKEESAEPTSRDPSAAPPPELTATGLEDEASLTTGIGNTLNLLKQRGLMESDDPGDLNAQYRARQRFLREKQMREEAAELKARQQRERDRTSGKLDRMSAREREEHARWENKQRDQAESRQMAEIFNREYNPVVDIRHVDDHGRELSQKEAFKYMSHQFHGKGSGKKKTEKHLKRVDDEKARDAQSVLDSGQRSGLNTALGQQGRKTKQAGVRLA